MNGHTRLVALLLIVVIVILAAAITRFYMNVPDNTVGSGSQTEISRLLDSDRNGNRIFADGAGSFGIADSSDRIIVPAEWHSLSFAGSDFCIASKKSGGKLLSGCIDYEGNVILPLIYRSITRSVHDEMTFFIAEAEGSGGIVVYNEMLEPCFNRTWISCEVGDSEISVTDDVGSYTFDTTEDGFLLSSASVSGDVLMRHYKLDVYSRVLLSKLSVSMLEDIVFDTGKYLEYAYSGDDELLADITTGRRSSFSELFPDDHRILSKRLMGISDIYVYSIRTDDTVPHYAVAVTADTELTYTDDSAQARSLRDEYKAVIEFSGSSDTNFTAVSASFELDSPEYPAPEPISDTPPQHEQSTDVPEITTEINKPQTSSVRN